MDTGRFDRFTRIMGEGSSRRTLFLRVAAGGATAAFAALGVRQAQAGDLAAERRRRRKSSSNTGSTTTYTTVTTIPPKECVTITGVPTGGPVQNATACTGGAGVCATGYCTGSGNLCQNCPTPCFPNGVSVCCPDGAQCINNVCGVSCIQPPPVITQVPVTTNSSSSSNSSGKKRRKHKKH